MLTGMGAVWQGTSFSFPWWCAYTPAAYGIEACRVPTQAEIDAAVKADISRAAGGNDAAASSQFQQYIDDTTAYCAAHPEDCLDYRAATSPGGCSGVFGSGPVGQFVCGSPALAAAIAVGALFMLRGLLQ